MAAIEFSFSEFAREILVIGKLAEDLILPDRRVIFHNLSETLNNIRSSAAGRGYVWGIKDSRPLRTVTSHGEYEMAGEGKRKGKHDVFAELSSIWEIAPLDQHSHRNSQHRRFALVGKASTRVTLFEETSDGPTVLGSWRMEIADDRAPGAYFHTQILGESSVPPFPVSLSIPRLPSLMFTPMLALEFVLGELFQDRWKRVVATETDELREWRTIQRKRVSSFLKWQEDKLKDASGTPWIAMKQLKPPADLFTPVGRKG